MLFKENDLHDLRKVEFIIIIIIIVTFIYC